MMDLIERARKEETLLNGYYRMPKAAAVMSELIAALEAAQEDRWRPIETAPKDGTSILLYYPDSGVIEGMWFERYENGNGGQWSVVSIDQHGCGCCADDSDQPTHWMPLPAPPKDTPNMTEKK